MANKRELKKKIRQICGNAAVEVLLSLPSEISHNIVLELAKLQTLSLSNVSFVFDHSAKDFENHKEYNKAKSKYNRAAYHRLKADFNKSLKEIVSQINTDLTREQLQANRDK